MKIKRIRSQMVRVPRDEPLAGGPPYARTHNVFVILRLETDDGIEGIGVSFFGGALSATLKLAVDQLGELIEGDDPLRIEAVVQKLRGAAASAGPGGILPLGIAGIEIALWDIKGKFFGQSLGHARRPARSSAGVCQRGLGPRLSSGSSCESGSDPG